MSLIIHSLLHSKWGFFPWCLTFFKTATISLDEFDAVGDHLNGTALDSFVGFPLVIIENAGDSDFSPLVQMLRADFRKAVEGCNFYPSGFFLTCPKCQIE